MAWYIVDVVKVIKNPDRKTTVPRSPSSLKDRAFGMIQIEVKITYITPSA